MAKKNETPQKPLTENVESINARILKLQKEKAERARKAGNSEQPEDDKSGNFSTDISLATLRDLGLKNGEWGFDSKPIWDRSIERWSDPLSQRVLAYLCKATLGYVPFSAGLEMHKGQWKILDRHNLCKKYNALLAVTKTETGFAAIGPQHIRKGLDSAAERAFIAQEGRVPTPEEKNNISVDPKVLRNVLESLELVGYCIRTNDDGVPLAELKGQTIRMSGGKLVSATKILSGENKIRVFLFLRPRPPKIRQEVPEKRVPQELNNRELKPLYVLIRGLKLDIEPVALAADTDLQATIRADMDAREAFNKQRDEALVKAILERYPSAQISAPNSNGKGQLSVGSPNPRSRNYALPPDGADSSMGAEDELVSQPRSRNSAPANPPATPPSAGLPSGEANAPASRPSSTNGDGGRAFPAADWDSVGRAAGQYFAVDDNWIRRLVAKCKERAPDITPEELAQLVHVKGPLATRKDAPGGFLLTAVPNLCEGESFRRLRERIASDRKQAVSEQSHQRQIDPLDALAEDIRFLRVIGPNHVEAVELSARLIQMAAQEPNLYAEALKRVEALERKVS